MAYYTPNQEAAVKKLLLTSNYYKILGLNKHFTQAQLTQAWKRLALQFHPDKNQAPGSTEATKAINRAYDVLSDPQKREEYEEELRESERWYDSSSSPRWYDFGPKSPSPSPARPRRKLIVFIQKIFQHSLQPGLELVVGKFYSICYLIQSNVI